MNASSRLPRWLLVLLAAFIVVRGGQSSVAWFSLLALVGVGLL